MATSKSKKTNPEPVLARNRRARHDYEIIDQMEAGLELMGSEVKSLRDRSVHFQDAYAEFRNNQLYLVGVSISHYKYSHQNNHALDRPRRILMHRAELDRWMGRVKQDRYSIVPLDIHVRGRWIKVEIALVRGMKDYDKRHALREKQVQRETDRVVKHGRYD